MAKKKTKIPKPATGKIVDRINTANHSMNPDRAAKPKGQGGGNLRTRSTIKRLRMYKHFKPKRDRKGKIVRSAPFQSVLASGTVARVEPDRRWFGNTKVVTQNALQDFQEEMAKVKKDPYKVVMKPSTLPVTLLNEVAKYKRVHLLDTETFENTFGKHSHRKRPSMKTGDLESMLNKAEELGEKYDVTKDKDLMVEDDGMRKEALEMIFKAGRSKRVWSELYKVIDSSDVVVQVLDARDPQGTRCYHVENYIRKEKQHKHIIFVLNKVDLVPVWVTQKWVAILSAEHPTMAFHASITNPFGKGALINLLRQFAKLHNDRKQISVGFIGYPNVGKSSIINTLRAKKVCKVAPIAGETKVWQYITLMRRIYLVDCPGVVYPTGSTPTDCVLKGVVRIEYVKSPEDYIPALLERVKEEYIRKTYKVESWTDSENLLEQIAKRSGKLLKKGDPDLPTVAKMILNDWQRGKIPYFVRPPGSEDFQKENRIDENKSQDVKTTTKVSEDNDKQPSSDNDTRVEQESVKDTKENSDSNETDISETLSKPKLSIPGIKQNFNKIHVEAEFLDEDIKPVECEDGDDDDVEEEDDNDDDKDKSIDEDDVEEVKEIVKTIYKKPVLDTLKRKLHQMQLNKGVVMSSASKSRSRSRKNKHPAIVPTSEQPESSDFIALNKNKPLKKISKKKPDVFSNISMDNVNEERAKGKETESSSAKDIENSKNSSRRSTRIETKTTASGKMVITVDESSANNTDADNLYEVDKKGNKKQETPKSNKTSPRKRKHDDDDNEEEDSTSKLNSKQRRRREKISRSSKIGVHYYQSANVKNRSNRRKQ
ncbi:hypothetical protein SNE40_004394 [Patella caerulea]|uniref:Nucleolar GTP-binding protein 2 n=1 Tax=Patella caerulea TaxID=87958 RepID=A0AAN8K4N4_PATCE